MRRTPAVLSLALLALLATDARRTAAATSNVVVFLDTVTDAGAAATSNLFYRIKATR